MKVGFYPYTYVRTNVMKSLLLKKEDYVKLMKMRVGEITKYLQDNQYQKDISGLGTAFSGAELIDRAIKANLDRNFSKLRRICDKELLILVDAYLRRYDISNIKTVLRVLSTGQDKDEAEQMLYDCGAYDAEYYKSLLRESNAKAAMEKLRTNNVFPKNVEGKEMFEVENELDKNYYESLLKLTDLIPEQINLFKDFLKREIEITNLLNVVRLKREGVSQSEINKILLPEKSRALQNQILPMNNVGEVLDTISKKSEYKNVIAEGVEEFKKTGSLTGVERNLKGHLLRKSVLLTHQDLLSVNVIIGFMFAKEVEVKNLRMLVKGKSLGIDDVLIEKELII